MDHRRLHCEILHRKPKKRFSHNTAKSLEKKIRAAFSTDPVVNTQDSEV